MTFSFWVGFIIKIKWELKSYLHPKNLLSSSLSYRKILLGFHFASCGLKLRKWKIQTKALYDCMYKLLGPDFVLNLSNLKLNTRFEIILGNEISHEPFSPIK